jgi:imidazolonepropionase-like amidohydrolase
MPVRFKILVLLALVSIAISGHASSGSTRFALMHVSVVDVVRGVIIPDQTVLIASERIVSLGPSSRERIPRGYSKIDARSKFLIPGLWDMHVHLAGLIADRRGANNCWFRCWLRMASLAFAIWAAI